MNEAAKSPKTLHAQVTAYKGRVVIELLAQASIPGQVTTSLDNPGVFGQVIENTREHLGVSQEALELLKKVKKGHDSLGTVDWFKTADDHYAFSWMGGPYNIFTPEDAEASRSYAIPESDFVLIENQVPEGAMLHIDGE